MDTSTSTRRTFVGGALAGAALMVPAALVTPRRSAVVEPDSGNGLSSNLVAMDPEASHWAAAVGRRFRLSSEDGVGYATLTHVLAGDARDDRRATSLRQPFRLRFAPDGMGQTARDAIYALDRPIAGARSLFMTHGLDEAGRSVLTAVFG